jgi:hypothetical protein
MRLIQIKKGKVRRVALVEEPYLRLLDGCSSIYALANVALAADMRVTNLIRQRDRHEQLEYDPIYNGRSEWRILPAIDHPEEPVRCLVSGTGLTHLGTAQNRQSVHEAGPEGDVMQVAPEGLGRPLRNPVRVAWTTTAPLIEVLPLR